MKRQIKNNMIVLFIKIRRKEALSPIMRKLREAAGSILCNGTNLKLCMTFSSELRKKSID
jgi:hypothetical protein